jgi:uncharacterized protein
MSSAIYFGTVWHERLRPRRHRLSYRVFSLLLDLDALPALAAGSRLFSYNRFNLFSFHDRDHGAGEKRALRPQVEAQLARGGIDLDGGAIRLLCFPRILGYVFNPLSVYFCHHRDGALRAILYEVNNTFGERHSYLIPVASSNHPTVRQSCRKEFYVSPFMEMECEYHFRIVPPGEQLAVVIQQTDATGPILNASLVGKRAELTDRALAQAFLRYPLMTLKVVLGIHWEALKLWRKGMKLLPRPKPPADPVTILHAAEP